ncbi:MAG: response regulator [Burkholderiales bacterium]|nr:response regulator [Burkholderiales bacterium]
MMRSPARILVVDDQPLNVKLLADTLRIKGYEIVTASSGEEALERIERDAPDLVLLDVMMPGMDGYAVCRAIRAEPRTQILPVIMVTALDPHEERVKGLEAGADDFLTKPVNQQELMARVKSLLRVKSLYDQVETQAQELADLNRDLERRVAKQVKELQRLSQLKRFFSPQLAARIIAGGAQDPLASHRREITVVFLDLRGFTSFAEKVEPEEVMALLREFHAAMGALIFAYEGTLERFTGDGLMVFFNDPEPIPQPVEHAVRMALAMRDRAAQLGERWRKLGYDLGLAIGLAHGYATLGAIGFEARLDYAAIGSVTNLAARLCAEAAAGEILLDARTLAHVESLVHAKPRGRLDLKGFAAPVPAHRIIRLATS